MKPLLLLGRDRRFIVAGDTVPPVGHEAFGQPVVVFHLEEAGFLGAVGAGQRRTVLRA